MSGPTPLGRRRVVVTGMGTVTPLANDVAGTWAALRGRDGRACGPSRRSTRPA